jgi:hypothetical protein
MARRGLRPHVGVLYWTGSTVLDRSTCSAAGAREGHWTPQRRRVPCPLALRCTCQCSEGAAGAGQGSPRAHATQTANEKLPRFWTGPDHGAWPPDPKILPQNHVTKRDLFSESVGNGNRWVPVALLAWVASVRPSVVGNGTGIGICQADCLLQDKLPALSLPAVPPALRLCESLGAAAAAR